MKRVCVRKGKSHGRKVCRKWRKAGLGLKGHAAGKGRFKVSCAGKRVYASASKGTAVAAARSYARARGATCTVFSRTKRIATVG